MTAIKNNIPKGVHAGLVVLKKIPEGGLNVPHGGIAQLPLQDERPITHDEYSSGSHVSTLPDFKPLDEGYFPNKDFYQNNFKNGEIVSAPLAASFTLTSFNEKPVHEEHSVPSALGSFANILSSASNTATDIAAIAGGAASAYAKDTAISVGSAASAYAKDAAVSVSSAASSYIKDAAANAGAASSNHIKNLAATITSSITSSSQPVKDAHVEPHSTGSIEFKPSVSTHTIKGTNYGVPHVNFGTNTPTALAESFPGGSKDTFDTFGGNLGSSHFEGFGTSGLSAHGLSNPSLSANIDTHIQSFGTSDFQNAHDLSNSPISGDINLESFGTNGFQNAHDFAKTPLIGEFSSTGSFSSSAHDLSKAPSGLSAFAGPKQNYPNKLFKPTQDTSLVNPPLKFNENILSPPGISTHLNPPSYNSYYPHSSLNTQTGFTSSNGKHTEAIIHKTPSLPSSQSYASDFKHFDNFNNANFQSNNVIIPPLLGPLNYDIVKSVSYEFPLAKRQTKNTIPRPFEKTGNTRRT